MPIRPVTIRMQGISEPVIYDSTTKASTVAISYRNILATVRLRPEEVIGFLVRYDTTRPRARSTKGKPITVAIAA